MKGYAAAPSSGTASGKRRWRSLAVGVVFLVLLSLFVPLGFLLGLHNNRYFSDDRSQSESSFLNYSDASEYRDRNPSEGLTVTRLDDDSHEKRFNATISEQKGGTSDPVSVPALTHQDRLSQRISAMPSPSSGNGKVVEKVNVAKSSTADEMESYCQLEFGSYCLWSREHKEVMKDSLVKRLKDQLFVARAYYPTIAKLKGKEQFSRELKLNIQEHERMLSEAISDPDLPAFVERNIQKMDEAIGKAKTCSVECSNVDRKLRQLVDLTEDEAHFHMKQSAFLYQLGVQTMSKTFHCLLMRLTVEYFRSPPIDKEQSYVHKLENPSLHHYIIFSRNILAVSVTINSTVMNSYESDNMIFHVITDRQNFFSMKHWFLRNFYKEAIVHVLNFNDLILNSFDNMGKPQMLPSEEFRVSIRAVSQEPSSLQMRTEYISAFGDSHFFLPEIFKNLNKVILLDDDMVVQQDLSSLWNIDLEGKVVAAAKFCNVRLGQLKTYLGSRNYDQNSCAWMTGLNIVDLNKWREYGITLIYQRFLNELQHDEASRRAATLPATLLALDGHIYGLDDSMIQSGLGHNYRVAAGNMKNAIALHYNGNMKPWLDLGIPKYKKFWKKYLTHEERFMDECNVNL